MRNRHQMLLHTIMYVCMYYECILSQSKLNYLCEIHWKYKRTTNMKISYFVSTHQAPVPLFQAVGRWRAAEEGLAMLPLLWLWEI